MSKTANKCFPAAAGIFGCAVFIMMLLSAPSALAQVAVDNAIMLDPFDPVPEIQFNHYGGYAWGYGCDEGCGERHCYHGCGYRRCGHGCEARRPCEHDCGHGDGCRGDGCYQRSRYDGNCRDDGCYRHDDGCRGDGCRADCGRDGCRDETGRYQEQADRYDRQSCWYQHEYMRERCDGRDGRRDERDGYDGRDGRDDHHWEDHDGDDHRGGDHDH